MLEKIGVKNYRVEEGHHPGTVSSHSKPHINDVIPGDKLTEQQKAILATERNTIRDQKGTVIVQPWK